MNHRATKVLLAAGSMLAWGLSTSALAQAVAPAPAQVTPPAVEASAAGTETGFGDIIVTARKRSESAMRTPVVISVLPAEKLADLHVQRMDDLGEVMPGLKIQRGIGGSVGTVVTVRGIGSGTAANYIDQSVGFAVDEVGYSHGAFYDAATFDLGQVELLKGPQGLFFGKSTTAGIVSFTTADPTPDWEGEISGGYEFTADEFNTNAYVSGPISDTLGVRVAGYYNNIKGYIYNTNPAGAPSQRRFPDGDEYGGRLTLAYASPGGDLRAKLKVAGTHYSSNADQQAMRQFVSCTLGNRPQNPLFQFDNCILDQYNIGVSAFKPYNPNIDWINSAGNTAAFANFSPFPATGDGAGFLRKKSILTSLNIGYDITQGLTLTGVFGYGKVNADTQQQGAIVSLGPYQLINYWEESDYSAEVRLASGWKDSWINFVLGALYAPGSSHNVFQVATPNITRFVIDTQIRKTRATSAFGQVLLTPIARVELSAGARYTHIKEYFPYLSALSNVVGLRPGDPGDASINQAPLLPRSATHFAQDNVSPEFTLTYRPTDDITTFASYKFGYKGPGYNATGFLITNYLAPNTISPFGGEKVRGAEAGVKAQLLDHHLNLTAAVYSYKYLGLQVSHYDGTRGVTTISNGADAITRGFELGASFRPADLRGFEVNADVAYNDAYYSKFTTSPCFGGQTAAQGCNANAAGVKIQDLTGRPLTYAPKLMGNVGAQYEASLGSGLTLTFSGTANFSSRYNYTPALHPRGWQNGFATLDGFIRLAGNEKLWEVALLGRNLTNKRYVVTGFDAGAFTPNVLSDTQGIINRSRQVMLQLTVRPF